MTHNELFDRIYGFTMHVTHIGWVVLNLETDEIFGMRHHGGGAVVKHDSEGAMEFIEDGLMPGGKTLYFQKMEDALLYIHCRINPDHPEYGDEYGDQMEKLSDKDALFGEAEVVSVTCG